jgi:hypothetical protein
VKPENFTFVLDHEGVKHMPTTGLRIDTSSTLQHKNESSSIIFTLQPFVETPLTSKSMEDIQETDPDGGEQDGLSRGIPPYPIAVNVPGRQATTLVSVIYFFKSNLTFFIVVAYAHCSCLGLSCVYSWACGAKSKHDVHPVERSVEVK